MNTELKIRYYADKEKVIITALKVGSRWCDGHFKSKAEEPEVYISPNNEYVEKSKFEDKYKGKEDKKVLKADLFRPMYQILRGEEKRPVYLLFRHPKKRAIAVMNHFFNNWMSNKDNNSVMTYDLPLLKGYDFSPNKEPEAIDNPEFIRQLNEAATKFVSFYKETQFQDPHYGPYMFLYSHILHATGGDGIHLVNIDELRIEDALKLTKSNLYKMGGMKSNPYTKNAMQVGITRTGLEGALSSYLYTETFHYNELSVLFEKQMKQKKSM